MNYESPGETSNRTMMKAVEILNRNGMDFFEMFANRKGISYCDRNRCITKCRVLYQREDLKEMPCPGDLLQARWEFYTKNMGYPVAKAKSMLAKIDASFESAGAVKTEVGSLLTDIGNE